MRILVIATERIEPIIRLPNEAQVSMLIWRILFSLATLPLVVGFLCSTASAQELVPRAYWPTPNGTNVFIFSYQHSSGDIVTDPSLPLTGIDSNIDYLSLSYQRTFNLLERTAIVQLSLPFSRGETHGFHESAFHRRETSGMTDSRVRLSINLKGAPSMDAVGFQALRDDPQMIIGASLLVQVPTGEYEPDKLINLGTNRWSVKPAIGVIWPLRPSWLLEFELGAWFFGDNDEFIDETRKQDPILSTEFHLVKRIQPGFWTSLDVNFYKGGRTSVGVDKRENLQRNWRAGVTMVFPFKRQHAIRSSISTGIVTKSGGDFRMLSLSYLYLW